MTMTAATPVLLLNRDYTPLGVVSWRKAVEKILSGKFELVEAYVDRFLRSPSTTFPFPAVVRLVTAYAKPKIKLSRRNVLARDGYTCKFCGVRPRRSDGRPRLADLTIDHVVPRSRAVDGWVVTPWNKRRVRVTSWDNLLTACADCNGRKGARTPSEAGMHMRSRPRVPTTFDIARMAIVRVEVPDEWKAWLPDDSPWRDYWSGELDDD